MVYSYDSARRGILLVSDWNLTSVIDIFVLMGHIPLVMWVHQ